MKKDGGFFAWGVFAIFPGWAMSYVYYLFFLYIPLFVIGVLLVWFSDQSLLIKTLSTIIPLVLWYPVLKSYKYSLDRNTHKVGICTITVYYVHVIHALNVWTSAKFRAESAWLLGHLSSYECYHTTSFYRPTKC